MQTGRRVVYFLFCLHFLSIFFADCATSFYRLRDHMPLLRGKNNPGNGGIRSRFREFLCVSHQTLIIAPRDAGRDDAPEDMAPRNYGQDDFGRRGNDRPRPKAVQCADLRHARHTRPPEMQREREKMYSSVILPGREKNPQKLLILYLANFAGICKVSVIQSNVNRSAHAKRISYERLLNQILVCIVF